MLSACDRKSAEPVDVPDYESGLTDRAWLVLDTGGDFSEAMGIQQEAVRLLREGKSREDPVAVLEQMATSSSQREALKKHTLVFVRLRTR